MQKTNSQKIWFAHMLRGIACLIVVFFHYSDIFWSRQERIVELANVHPTTFSSDIWLMDLSNFLGSLNINLGAVGVGLFFIISGFVIPFSLEYTSKLSFLIKRFFRIIPPYAIGLFLTFSTVFLYAKYYGLQFPYTFLDYLVNASLLRDILGFVSIDGINWTLEVEIKFYILCVLLTVFSSLKNNKTIIITSLIMLFITMLYALNPIHPYVDTLIAIITKPTVYLTYMLIGVCFYNLYKLYWKTPAFIGSASLIFIVTLANTYLRIPESFFEYLVSYSIALFIFLIFYLFKEKLGYNSVLNFFANISYPLYIIHGVIGYTLITLFYKAIPNPYVVILIVFGIVTAISYLHHKFIEEYFNKLGKHVAKSYGKNKSKSNEMKNIDKKTKPLN